MKKIDTTDKTPNAKPLNIPQKKHIAKRIEQHRDALLGRIENTRRNCDDTDLLKKLKPLGNIDRIVMAEAKFGRCYKAGRDYDISQISLDPDELFTDASLKAVKAERDKREAAFNAAKLEAEKSVRETAARAMDEVIIGGADLSALDSQMAALDAILDKFAKAMSGMGVEVSNDEHYRGY
jgi:hypothetical protein